MRGLHRLLLITLGTGAMLLCASAAVAQTFTYDVLFDLDRDAATGCDSAAPGGTPIPGNERRLRATVDASTTTVETVTLAFCAGTAFGPPVTLGGPYPVGLDDTVGVIEAAVSLAELGADQAAVGLAFVAADATGSDVLAASGGPTLFGLSSDAIGIPALSAWGLALLVLILMLGMWRYRRTGRGVGLAMLVLAASAALAANFVADGDIGDWAGVAPRATDPAGDATNGGTGNDLREVFFELENGVLFFRMDVTGFGTQAPVAADDAFATDEDTVLNIAAPGVLANDSDPESDPLTAVLLTGPGNAASFGLNADGSFDYAPTADFNGTDSFTYAADDGAAQSAPATVTLTVTPVNDPPVAVDDAITTDMDTPVTFDPRANDSDPDSDPLTIIAVGAPSNGGAVINGGTSVTYTPDLNFNGSDTFTYTIEDGNGGTDTDTVSVTVAPVNDPPTAVDDVFIVDEDSTNNALNVLANDTDPDTSDTLTITAVGTPDQGGSATTDGSSVDYTPATGFDGVENFTYTIEDGNGGADTATVVVTVGPVNDPPVAVDDTVGTNEDTPVTFDPRANDSDPEGDPLTIVAVGAPSNGGAVINTGTSVTYTPDVDFNGADTFTYTIDDGNGGSDTATVSVTVNAVNDDPVAVDDSYATDEDTSLNVAAPGVLTNDTDVDGDALTAILETSVSNGTLTLNADGSFSYTPSADFNGTDSFTYHANDGTADSNTVTVTMTVNAVNDTPTFTAGPDQTVLEDAGPQTVAGWASSISAGPSDEAGQVLTFNITGNSNPALFSAGPVVNAAGALSFTSAPDAFGTATVALTLSDDGGTANGGVDTSPAQSFTITVNPVNDAPVPVNHTLTTHSAIRITLGAGDSEKLKDGAADVDDPFAALSVSPLPSTTANGALLTLTDAASGTYQYDPPGGFTGNDSFTYQVCDNASTALPVQCATATVDVTVTGPALWVVDPAAAAGGDGSLNRPFQALSNLPGGRAAGGHVFLASGTNSGGHGYVANERLIGQGATGDSFDGFLGVLVPTNGTLDARPAMGAARPTVQGQVTLANGVLALGFDIAPASGTQGLVGSGALTGIDVDQMAIATTNAVAVNLDGPTGTFTLDSVEANGGTNGIVLVNTNSVSGSFSVTGTGGDCTATAPTCSGGRIQATTGANGAVAGNGIYLENTRSVSLTRMRIGGHQNHAIFGDTVTGFMLTDSLVDGANGDDDDVDEGSVRFVNLLGSAAITRADISGGLEDNLRLVNSTGTLDRLVITDSIFRDNSASLGNDGILMEANGTAVMNVTVDNSDFSAHRGDHFDAAATDGATLDLVFTNNSMSGGHSAPLGQSFILSNAQSSEVTFDVSGNSINGSIVTAFIFFQSESSTVDSSIVGTFTGNTVGTTGVAGSGSQGNGVNFNATGDGTMTALADGNTIRQWSAEYGFLVQAGAGSPALNVTATNNLITEPDTTAFPINGLHLNAGTTSAGMAQVCLDARNNDILNSAGTTFDDDFRLRQRHDSTVSLPGYAGAEDDTAAVVTFVQGNNTGTPTGSAEVPVSGSGGGFTGGAACDTP